MDKSFSLNIIYSHNNDFFLKCSFILVIATLYIYYLRSNAKVNFHLSGSELFHSEAFALKWSNSREIFAFGFG